jgi:hypothetical protein
MPGVPNAIWPPPSDPLSMTACGVTIAAGSVVDTFTVPCQDVSLPLASTA